MFTSEGNRLRAIELQLNEQQKLTWGAMILGMALGFLGLHFMVTRPLVKDLQTVRAELSSVDQRMKQLASVGDGAWETTSLLTHLKSQAGQMQESRAALNAIRQLRIEIMEEARATREAVVEMQQLQQLRQTLISGRQSTKDAEVALGAMQNVQAQLISQGEAIPAATAALEQMISLSGQVRDQQPSLADSRLAIDQLAKMAGELRSQLLEMDRAWSGLKEMTALKASIMDEAANLPAAQASAQQLIALRQRLGEERIDALVAAKNLDSLLKMQTVLTAQTPKLADAVQTLEMIAAFQEEFISHAQTLGVMRKNLMEIAILEPTLVRVFKMLQPLTELTNLRRLGDDELRQAARVILDQRSTKLTRRFADDAVLGSGEDRPYDEPVPQPTQD